MTSKNFKLNDLVWAKMKGYPHWPGNIASPPENSKTKKNHQYVYFFGSNNYSWIAEENIELHNAEKLAKYGQRKGELFKKAVDTIVKMSTAPKSPETISAFDKIVMRDEAYVKLTKLKSILDEVQDLTDAKPAKTKSTETANSVPKSKETSELAGDVQNSEGTIAEPGKAVSKSTEAVSKSVKAVSKSVGLKRPSETKEGAGTKKLKPTRTYIVKSPQFKRLSKKSPKVGKSSKIKIFARDDDHDKSYLNLSPPGMFLYKRPKSPPVTLKYNPVQDRSIVPTDKKIGFLGLSTLGQLIIRNLYHAKHSVIIWNEKPEICEKFAKEGNIEKATTPAELIQAADIVFCYTSDAETAKNLVVGENGILEGLEQCKGNRSYVDLTTMDPKMSQMIATEITSKGGRYLEAPVSRSRFDATQANLLIVAAGDKALYDECKSCFDAISYKHLFTSAEVGNASKLINIHSMLLGTAYAAFAEVLTLIDNSAGETKKHFRKVYEDAASKSNVLFDRNNIAKAIFAMSTKNYTTNLSLREMQQSFSMGISLGHEVSQHCSIFSATKEVYKRCISLGYGDHDVTSAYEGVCKRYGDHDMTSAHEGACK